MSKKVVIETPAGFEPTQQNVHAFAIAKLVNYWQRAEEDAKRTGEPFCPEFPAEIYLVNRDSIEPLAQPEPEAEPSGLTQAELKSKFKIIRTPKA